MCRGSGFLYRRRDKLRKRLSGKLITERQERENAHRAKTHTEGKHTYREEAKKRSLDGRERARAGAGGVSERKRVMQRKQRRQRRQAEKKQTGVQSAKKANHSKVARRLVMAAAQPAARGHSGMCGIRGPDWGAVSSGHRTSSGRLVDYADTTVETQCRDGVLRKACSARSVPHAECDRADRS
ncbi:hypothetical protein TBLA_0A02890 [Henningerozyma blattae CBS 6284]|uniref:Uncharacterized protein n=1 Tax=Henningerozyma blattae (strain ATCC 34711 / CBS 6284 / DSM 70876 / NBRC 10599 / NRRL Y-10934 / UCD 77-7) TaxID=1071380 RepID=I2GVD7_HENB6|nr:hypothetical protein TBLA_0A02890 [Tetrapisispora blattae CBS 6284]CCH58089.1 hypothetical protein TBLA_0A02890 [Tetrapisispora blattae CBS 6284]